MTWKPSVTVAAVMERHGRFLRDEDYLTGMRYPLELITHFA